MFCFILYYYINRSYKAAIGRMNSLKKMIKKIGWIPNLFHLAFH